MRNSSKILIVVLVIVATFSLGTVGGYLLFREKYVSNKDNTQINNDKANDFNKEESLTLDNDLIKNLYKRKTNFRTVNKVTYNILSDQLKFSAYAREFSYAINQNDINEFKQLSATEICSKIKDFDNLERFYDTCLAWNALGGNGDDQMVYYVSVDSVKNRNAFYYNDSRKLPETFNGNVSDSKDSRDDFGIAYDSNNQYYLVVDLSIGYSGMPVLEYEELTKVLKKDDTVIIYEKYLKGVELNHDEKTQKFNYKIYSDAYEENYIKDITVDYSNDDYITPEIKSLAQAYKHTYKLNDNGEYYWVSSEPVNNID